MKSHLTNLLILIKTIIYLHVNQISKILRWRIQLTKLICLKKFRNWKSNPKSRIKIAKINSLTHQKKIPYKTVYITIKTKRFLLDRWRAKIQKINIRATQDIKTCFQTKKYQLLDLNKFQKQYKIIFRLCMICMKDFKCSQTCCKRFIQNRFKNI
jgi:hypothetical protein